MTFAAFKHQIKKQFLVDGKTHANLVHLGVNYTSLDENKVEPQDPAN
jgi:hypothetical protein